VTPRQATFTGTLIFDEPETDIEEVDSPKKRRVNAPKVPQTAACMAYITVQRHEFPDQRAVENAINAIPILESLGIKYMGSFGTRPTDTYAVLVGYSSGAKSANRHDISRRLLTRFDPDCKGYVSVSNAEVVKVTT
jgi:hypothetical protein